MLTWVRDRQRFASEDPDPVRARPAMLSTCFTATPHGVETLPVEVEIDLSKGLPGFYMVGLPDSASREGKERVRAALAHQGFRFPTARIAVNLAPATLPKKRCALDLAIGAGILQSSGQIPQGSLEHWGLWGELAFHGGLRPLPGALGVSRGLAAHTQVQRLLVPRGCGPQAAMQPGIEVYEASDLKEAMAILSNPQDVLPCPAATLPPSPTPDWSAVRNHPFLFQALTVAAAGGHGMLLQGPPGGGKTFLARRFADLLPDLAPEEALEVAAIHSASGRLAPELLPSARPPVRQPGPGISREALVGGGRPVSPGEITMAHRGVLFLDEASELPRHVLDALRTPLVDREVWVNRAQGSFHFPADFQLLLAANPCPCGFDGDPNQPCCCSQLGRRRHLERLSGPLLDRIDMQIWVPRLAGLNSEPPLDPLMLRQRVLQARRRQHDRWGEKKLNARAGLRELLSAVSSRIRGQVSGSHSPRAQEKILGLTWTLADLEGRPFPLEIDLERAIGMRFRARMETAA